MDDLEGIREQAVATLRLASAEIRGDAIMESLAQRLEDGARILPITNKSSLVKRLRDYLEAHDALADADAPDGLGIESILEPGPRRRAIEASDALKATISFGELSTALAGSWSSDAITGAIRDLRSAMEGYGAGAPSP